MKDGNAVLHALVEQSKQTAKFKRSESLPSLLITSYSNYLLHRGGQSFTFLQLCNSIIFPSGSLAYTKTASRPSG